jgi:hypothetical protein
MIQKIQTYINSLFFKPKIESKKIENNQDNKNKSIYIQFILNENNNIEISCGLPYENNLTDNSIIDLSERYAELLLGINNSLLKNQIVDTLKKESKNTDNHQKILLIDNIISFYEILKNEQIKSSVFYYFPVVSPSMVFHENKS